MKAKTRRYHFANGAQAGATGNARAWVAPFGLRYVTVDTSRKALADAIRAERKAHGRIWPMQSVWN